MTTNDHRPPPWAPPLAFAGCCLIWGSTFLVISVGNDALPPFFAAAMRLGIAAVLLAIIVRIAGFSFPSGRALAAAAAFGFLNFGLGFSFLYWAERTIPSGLAAVVYATVPLSTAMWARLAGLERLAPRKLLGAVIALGGVAVIFRSRLDADLDWKPSLAILLATIFSAASGVALKKGPRQNPLGANAVGAFVGFVVCMSVSLVAGEDHRWPTPDHGLWPTLYLATFGSIGAFGLFAWLVNHWEVTRVSFISVVTPSVGLLLGWIFRGERLSAAAIAGSLLVLAGVVIAILIPVRPAPTSSADK